METYNYKTEIQAPAEKIWELLWNEDTYQQWTAPFAPGSKIQSDWKIGGRTLFLDGQGNGMVSTIQTYKAPNKLVFEHLGVIKDGVEDTTSDEVKGWQGSLEKYLLTEENGQTVLEASVESDPQFKEMMDNGFTKGFAIVKTLAETK